MARKKSKRNAEASEVAPKAQERKRRRGRPLMLLVLAGVVAIAINEGLRSRLLDMLFGAEEEFDYTSTTTPATPAPAAVAGD